MLWSLRSVAQTSLLVLGFIVGLTFLYGLVITRKTSLSNLVMALSLFVLSIIYFFQYLIQGNTKSLVMTILGLLFMILIFGRVRVASRHHKKKTKKLQKVYDVNKSSDKKATKPSKKPKSSNQTKKSLSKLIASKSGKKYHVPGCDWAKQINPKNKVFFDSEAQAKEKGLKPCSCVKA